MSTADGAGGVAVSTRVDRAVRRYEPVIISLGAILLIITIVSTVRDSDAETPRDTPPVTVAPAVQDFGGPEPTFFDPPADTPVASPSFDFSPSPASPLPSGGGGGTPAPSGGGGGGSPPAAPASTTSTTAAPSFADGGSVGDAAVLGAIPGRPVDVVTSRSGTVYVSVVNGDDGSVVALDAAGKLGRQYPLGDGTGAGGMAPGKDNRLYVAAPGAGAVLVLDLASGAVSEHAEIPDVQPCVPGLVATNCDGALPGAAPEPADLAFDSRGNLFVSDRGQAAIWRLPSGGGDIEQLVVERSWSDPTRVSGPGGIAVDGAGNVVIAVASLLGEEEGGVFIQSVRPDGTAGGELVELYRSEGGELPMDVALGRSGTVYVSLSGADQLAVLGPDGKERSRVPSKSGSLQAPLGVGFRGKSVLATSLVPEGSTPEAGVIVRLPVGEEGSPVHLG